MGKSDFQDAVEMTEVDTQPKNTAFPDAAKSNPSGEKDARIEHEGEISLHIASEEGNLAAVQTLLDGGAKVNQRDATYKTP